MWYRCRYKVKFCLAAFDVTAVGGHCPFSWAARKLCEKKSDLLECCYFCIFRFNTGGCLTRFGMWYIVYFEQNLGKVQKLLRFLRLYLFPTVAFILVTIMQKLTLEKKWLEISLYNQIYMSHKGNRRLYL